MLKIGISGPECSGKSVLARTLSKQFGEPLVPEFARHYLQAHGAGYEADMVEIMEKGQLNWEQAASRLATNMIICDTDYLVYRIWKKYKNIPDEHPILAPCSLHLICKPDLPWVFDPLREHPYERDGLFAEYLSLAQHLHLNFAIVEGDSTQRISIAVNKVTEHLSQHR